MFFVLTTGRSGSTSIATMLDSVAGCHAVHEPAPELILESAGYRYGKVSPKEVRAVLSRTRPATVNGDIYCESNQTLSLIIPELVETFPQARFIWLIRNGLDMVASAYQKQWYTGHSENHDRYEDCSPLEKSWIDGRVRADLVGEMNEIQWNALDRFEKCCWYWGYVNRIIGEDLGQYAPGRFYTLRLEYLERDFADLVGWMGLTPPSTPNSSRKNIAKRIPFHWTGWSPEQHQAFARWCKEKMDLFYPGWQSVIGDDAKVFISPVLASKRKQIEILEGKLNAVQAEIENIKQTKKPIGLPCLKLLKGKFKGRKT